MPGKSNLTKIVSLMKPDEVYYPNLELKSFLRKTPTANFLDVTLLTDITTRTDERSLLQDLGVFFRPRRFYMERNTPIFERQISTNDWNNSQINLEGLSSNLKDFIDKKSSLKLWRLLGRVGHEYWRISGFQKTQFINVLKETKWLYNKYGILSKPSEIIYKQLDEAYDNAMELKDSLNFKPDEISLLEDAYNGKFLKNEDYANLLKEIEDKNAEIERLKNTYEPDTLNIDDDPLPPIDNIELGDALPDSGIIKGNNPPPLGQQIITPTNPEWAGIEHVYTNIVPTRRQKNIGVRGEELVLKKLSELYSKNKAITVLDLNDELKTGAGCDILIQKDGKTIYFIEVKTTEGGFDNLFKLSNLQFRTALLSHLDKNAPTYQLYCVYWAASTAPQFMIIEDPIKYILNLDIRVTELWFTVKR